MKTGNNLPLPLVGQLSVGYISCCHDHIPDKKNLKLGEFLVTYRLRVYPMIVGSQNIRGSRQFVTVSGEVER